ncbi:MAG TPA: signal peptidase II [Candidatus Saccharicenans sp.]|jgi:signal peptidase II|nr:signal peptidase II [Candidatus Saccharicenans sp.]HNT00620.1 signal peptidase II [Candidatus Saccharicenans sp.]HPB58713.1 signal peptidase II [Candidatus Saccharicenans sp.]HQO75943.1 signal peptidase II [Candidatus Saccharicenans sp.]HUM79154.1 signal peptidase II [Candidatus Saccharicenans sp.]
MKLKNHFYYLFILVWIALDQLTKYLVARSISLYEVVPVIPGFFNLTRVHNRGAIFGFLSNSQYPAARILLNLGAILALGVVVYYFFKTPAELVLSRLSLSLIIGGAIGNILDRLFRGYVIDFLDFYAGSFHWPFFNLADSCITVGVILLLFDLLRSKGRVSHPA